MTSSDRAPTDTGDVDGSVATPSPTTPEVPAVPGQSATADATGDTADGAAHLPQAFPLPPGTSVSGVTDDGDEVAATLTVPSSAQPVTYWRSALPRAGYAVTSVQTVGGLGEIRFSGHGCGGDSQLATQGTTVTLQCDRT